MEPAQRGGLQVGFGRHGLQPNPAPAADNPAFLAHPDGTGPRLHLDEDDGTHLDLWVDRENSDVPTEVDRLLALGASRVDWQYPEGADFVVLADTEGNLFCVIS